MNQAWLPSSKHEIVGNHRMKKLFGKLIHLKNKHGKTGFPQEFHNSFLITGASRSGKTATVKHFVRCLLCDHLDVENQQPCGECDGCSQSLLGEQNNGIFHDPGKFEFCPLDCSRVKKQSDLTDPLYLDVIERSVPRINFLDEVHFLANRDIANILLKAVEERPAMWILSTARPELMDEMLLKRSLTISTEPPSQESLMQWIVDRAREFKVDVTADELVDWSRSFVNEPGMILKELELKRLIN